MAETSWSHQDAVEVLRRCSEAGSVLNELVLMADRLPETEMKRVRRAFANVIFEMFIEIETPIHKTYPDLIPPHLDLSRPMNAPDPD